MNTYKARDIKENKTAPPLNGKNRDAAVSKFVSSISKIEIFCTFVAYMETVVSGIRSTGKLHLGNYYGAVKNFIKMQEKSTLKNCRGKKRW